MDSSMMNNVVVCNGHSNDDTKTSTCTCTCTCTCTTSQQHLQDVQGQQSKPQEALGTSMSMIMSKEMEMDSCTANRLDLLLVSFSSLLSSAYTNGVQHSLVSSQADTTHLLSSFLSSLSYGNSDGSSLSIPSLKLRGRGNRNQRNIRSHSHSGHHQEPQQLMEVMALSLAEPLNAHRNNVDVAPNVLLTNISCSFQELISSRLRVSAQAITNRFLKMNAVADSNILRKLLTTSNPVKITTLVTSFQAMQRKSNALPSASEPLVKPLVFETIVDLIILGKMYTVTLQAPGTIAASLCPVDNLLNGFCIALDTMALLKSMMTQARLVVKKAINRAATITSTVSTYKKNIFKISNSFINHGTSSADADAGAGRFGDNYHQSHSDHYHQQQQKQQQQQQDEQIQQNNLLASYPEHLRETVQHFLPPVQESEESFDVEGFPPNLLQTLKALANDKSNNNNSMLMNYDDNNHNLDAVQPYQKQQQQQQQHIDNNGDNAIMNQQAQQLHQGLFSWMNNDEIMLKRSSKKVSFVLPNNNENHINNHNMKMKK